MEASLSQGDYADVAVTARIADAIARLLELEKGKEAVGDHLDVPEVQAKQESVRADPPTNSQRRRTARDCPRFERDGEKLVKVAWSKRDRAEYEHRAPRRVVQMLIDAIRKKKGEAALFQAADILPVKDPSSHQEVPSYQSYLALAWLQHEDVIIKQGREGYILKPATGTPEILAKLWEALPKNK